MDAHIDRVHRTNAGLLVVSTLDTLATGASTNAELERYALRALAAVAVRHRIAVLVVHDSRPRDEDESVARVIFDTASIVFALDVRGERDREGRCRVRALQLRAHRIVTPTLWYDFAPAPRVRGHRALPASVSPLPFPRESRRAARDR